MELGLSGRVALVMGAAERGIGYACAEALAREGARVAICSRRPEAIEAAASELRAAVPNAGVLAVSGDATRPDDVDRLLQTVVERFGHVEVLVNSVGLGFRGSLFDLADEAWQQSLEANLLQAVRLARGLLPPMLANGWGRVIHIAAVSGRQPTEHQMVANTTKAALMSFTKSLSTEVAASGVTVNCV